MGKVKDLVYNSERCAWEEKRTWRVLSEEKPPAADEYLTSDAHGIVRIQKWNPSTGKFIGWNIVKAWKPVPEAWREEG